MLPSIRENRRDYGKALCGALTHGTPERWPIRRTCTAGLGRLEGFRILTEFRVDPWTLGNSHITAQNFLQILVVGGVFERHPQLRVGVIEMGGIDGKHSAGKWFRQLERLGAQVVENFFVKNTHWLLPEREG